MLTKRQKRWLEIAEAFATPPENRTENQRYLTHFGLCFAIRRRLGHHDIDRFYEIVRDYCTYGTYSSYVWPIPDDDSRRDFALLMAAMSDRDYNRLSGIEK